MRESLCVEQLSLRLHQQQLDRVVKIAPLQKRRELEEDVFELAARWVLRLVVSPRVWARLLDELLL